jgi:hypothetical protein
MQKGRVLTIVGSGVLAAAAISLTSEAQAAGGQWGLHSGDTLSSKNLMVYGELGWPGITLGAQYGVSDKIDIGGRFAFLYGPLYGVFITPGMSIDALIRIGLIKDPKYSLLLYVAPGVKFASFAGPFFGIDLPFGVEFGLHLTPEATLQFGLDVPFYLNLTGGVLANIPPMAGPGFEYHIGDNIALGANTRFGATILAGGAPGATFSGATFGFLTQAYFAYKIF